MKERRKFDREFKDMVVQLSFNRDDITALAAEMDLRADLNYRWKREAEAHQGARFPGHGIKILTEEQKEITRIKKSCEMHR